MLLKLFMFWMVALAVAINRPVYKVTLTQRGFTQFLQYDLETPPLVEFTFCTWIRLFDLRTEQTFFSYIVNSNKNMVRLWVDPGGRNVQLTINGWLATTSPIEMIKDVWKHVCMSYQSDFGAWALYVDSRLVTCGASRALHGFILPPGGSVSVGYGTSEDGMPSGIEGEIFGANMILLSTIERNHTKKQNPKFEQRRFPQNRIKKNRAESNQYIVLDEIVESNILNGFEKTPFPSPSSMRTLPTTNSMSSESSSEREILDIAIPRRQQKTNIYPTRGLWHVTNSARHNLTTHETEPFNAGTSSLPSVSEFETPPPPPQERFFKEKHAEKLGIGLMDLGTTEKTKTSQKDFDISDIEVPPPPQTDKKVYGQWASSKFVGSVLNHLRAMQFQRRDKPKPIPPTIPLHKISDSFPYSSEFKLTKIKQTSDLFNKRRPKYNADIMEDDLREKIQRSHSKLKVRNVMVTTAGEPELSQENNEHHKRFHRQVRYSSSESDESMETSTPRPLTDEGLSNKKDLQKLLSILPYLKILQDFIEDSKTNQENQESLKTYRSNVHTRSLSNGSKWHNINSYSNDYTPRQIDVHSLKPVDIHSNLVSDNNKHPAVRLHYHYKEPIKQGQSLAKAVSSPAEVSLKQTENPETISIQQFVRESLKEENKIEKSIKNLHSHNFNKRVKLGNALSEINVIGNDALENKYSFEGGDPRVPDINRYRSDIDQHQDNVPPSLSPKVCKNVELYNRVLYIQPDESVDLTHFLSPVKLKNHAIEFIQQNYKMCSYDGSLFEKDPLLYINWSKTPVRLFGGAHLQITTDLCGFFKR